MKTNAKVLKNVGLLFIFIACLSFGYTTASKIWKLGDVDIYLYGFACLFFALVMFAQAKKKKAEEENKTNP